MGGNAVNDIQLRVDAVSLGSVYALVALGIGLIFGVMRMINFAQGDLIMLGAYALVVPTTADVAPPLIGAWPGCGIGPGDHRNCRLRRPSHRAICLSVLYVAAKSTARRC